MMKTNHSPLTLREHFRIMERLPRYVSHANQMTEAEASELCAFFPGLTLDDVRREFDQANKYGQERMTRADLRGDGLGMFSSAFRLFYGYIYESERCADCDSQESARKEQYDE